VSLFPVLESGKFIVTSEVGPPKGTHVEHCLEDAELLRGKVDGINVTDLQAAAMRVGSAVICHLLKDRGLEPILQMVCRDRNRIALQSDLLGAWVLGIENVLCLTGDHNTLGDHPESSPVFDLDSVSLLHAAKRLCEGRDLADNELEGAPNFCLGAVVAPAADHQEAQLIKLERKVEAGAHFIQTQAVYEVDRFVEFMDKVRKHGITVPVLAGIVLLKSAGMARYMNNNVAGVSVPDALIKRMSEAGAADKSAKEEGKKGGHAVGTSIEIAAELIKGFQPHCQGVHVMPLGWDRHVPPVLDAAGLNGKS
jgi:methylenetetrahydrofolate reductase (NADPH)